MHFWQNLTFLDLVVKIPSFALTGLAGKFSLPHREMSIFAQSDFFKKKSRVSATIFWKMTKNITTKHFHTSRMTPVLVGTSEHLRSRTDHLPRGRTAAPRRKLFRPRTPVPGSPPPPPGTPPPGGPRRRPPRGRARRSTSSCPSSCGSAGGPLRTNR